MANYGTPYRAPAQGWSSPRRYFLGTPYNHGRPGDIVTRLQNVTSVRTTDGSTITNVAFPSIPSRWYVPTYDAEHSSAHCSTLPAGSCGAWLAGADLNGLSTQAIADTVDDILACGSGVTKADHNCYQANSTVDLRVGHKRGSKNITIQKSWHGVMGFIDRCDPYIPNSVAMVPGPYTSSGTGVITIGTTPAGVAPQVKFLTAALQASSIEDHVVYAAFPPVLDYSLNGSATSTGSVDRLTGIQTQATSYAYDLHGGTHGPTEANTIFDWLNGKSFADVASAFSAWQYTAINGAVQNPATAYYTRSGNTFTLMSGTYEFDPVNHIWVYDQPLETIVIDLAAGNFSRKVSTTLQVEPDELLATYRLLYEESAQVTNTVMTYTYQDWFASYGLLYSFNNYGTGTLTLSNPYTSADCYQDWLAAAGAYDLTSDTDYPFRTDEQMANTPLVIYDELPPTAPPISCPTPSAAPWSATGPTMDDYTQPQNVGGSWPQRAWIDPNNYIWKSATGGFATVPDAGGGNELITPLRTGAIITHNPGGCDAHFWFGALVMERVASAPGDPNPYTWQQLAFGQAAPSPLPKTTMRWQRPDLAQYDTQVTPTPSPGNLPQNWLREAGGVLTGGKYIEAKELWNSVNFARPYGKDHWAVDQTTVCAMLGGGVIRRTGNAINPLAAGGLAVGDTVMIGGDGIYQITGLGSASGISDWTTRPQYAFTVGSKLADIPADCDIGDGYIGRMRWWGYPPFGCTAVTGVYDGTSTTTFTLPATPYWTALAGSPTASVDLYAATSGNPAAGALNGSAVTLTKTGTTTATVPGNYATALFIVPHGLKPWFDDAGSKGDFVQLTWDFNSRAAASWWTGSVPLWYGATLVGGLPTGGTPGCIDVAVAQANIKFIPCCPAVVGFVPYYSGLADTSSASAPTDSSQPPATGPVEHFNNQNLAQFPSTFLFDDLASNSWLGAIETTMADPFWQVPFKPDLAGELNWVEDDGSGHADDATTTPPTAYYPGRPLVEALRAIPGNYGWGANETPALPAGLTLAFDPAANLIPPPYWPNGIPIGDETYTGEGSASFATLWRPFGFQILACGTIAGAGRFAGDYTPNVKC